MQTVNISLPKTLSKKVDSIVEKEGYGSRSELFRELLRSYMTSREEKNKIGAFQETLIENY